MNKFENSECEDFRRVSGKIVEMLLNIREGTPLKQADDKIRTECYTPERLEIERLSGDLLSLEHCYINLLVVEKPRKNTLHEKEEPGEDASPHTSPFSLTARLKVETPNKNIQVELPSLFDSHTDSTGKTVEPRGILIRGRAGVGKSTLCKKMVYEFAHYSKPFPKWNELFDRVLWVPLRRLKAWQTSQYDLGGLFSREYFIREKPKIRKDLAEALWDDVGKKRTLFILDGLDEIAQELGAKDQKSDFLESLLNQPNVVITSRPHMSLPRDVQSPDLEFIVA